MKTQARFLFGIVVVIAWLAATVVPGMAEGLSKEQGDAILTELRQIRSLLERPQRPPAPAPQGPPPQEKVSLKLGDEYALGRGDAPVTIVEYTDYQCPFCNRFHVGAYPEIRKNFIDTGKVRFIKRDLALDFHPKALKAAQAARCAGDQGKFWEMHDLLSANPETLGPEAYAKFAGDIALDAGTFRSCVESDTHLAAIRGSAQGAAAIGINGTPSFVVGTVTGDTLVGVRIVGAQPYPVFEKAIRESLAPKPGGKPAN
jgi:protein-disulfide isomerase